MLFDVKKFFSKETTLGRFEYLKTSYGLIFFPVIFLILVVITPPDVKIYYPVVIIATIVYLLWVFIRLFATYKRLANIFNSTALKIVLMILYIFGGIIHYLKGIFDLLLLLIPGKKGADNVFSNKFFFVSIPLTVLLFVTNFFLGYMRHVSSNVMIETIQPKDRICVNIFDKNYKRGDIITYKIGKYTKWKGIIKTDIVFIQRIIALPGEKVEIKTTKDGAKNIFINDKVLTEPYVKDLYNYPQCSSKMKCEAIIVPEDSYYVLGDNRGNAYDSRYFGPVKKDMIQGKVSHIFLPLSRRQSFKPIQY